MDTSEKQKSLREKTGPLRLREKYRQEHPIERSEHHKRPSTVYSYKTKLPGLMRLLVAILFFIAEVALLIWFSLSLTEFSFGFLVAQEAFAFLFSLLFLSRENDPFEKFWLVLILTLPAPGLLMYLLWGRKRRVPRQLRRYLRSTRRLLPRLDDAIEILEIPSVQALPPADRLPLHYLAVNQFPAYLNSDIQYVDTGEAQFARMLDDLETARHYIFLEYFIIADGLLLTQVIEVLKRKAAQGVDVRLLFDDVGSTTKAPERLIEDLQAAGIRALNFNPVLRYTSGLYVNYRNHQKLCLVDGRIGWLGGANLADEYANIYKRFGYWKDTAVRLEGDACRSLLAGFLLMWEQDARVVPDLNERELFELTPRQPVYPAGGAGSARSKQAAATAQGSRTEGGTSGLSGPGSRAQSGENRTSDVLVAPFWDGPLNDPQNTAADLFAILISQAVERLYLSSPYLVLTKQLSEALCLQARAGVDVRILMPGIPDKKQVNVVTRANYRYLLESGVRIFEFTPGFVHAKLIVADGRRAVAGSFNLDYRSLYLNFENGVYMVGSPAISAMEQDLLATMAAGREITLESWRQRPLWDKLREPIWQLFTPLL